MKAAAVIHNSNPITQDLDKITYQLVTKQTGPFHKNVLTPKKRASSFIFNLSDAIFLKAFHVKNVALLKAATSFLVSYFVLVSVCFWFAQRPPNTEKRVGGRPALLARRALLYALFGALNVFPFLCFFCYTIRIRFFSQIGILGRQSFSMLCYNNKKVLYIHHNNTQWVLATNCSWL